MAFVIASTSVFPQVALARPLARKLSLRCRYRLFHTIAGFQPFADDGRADVICCARSRSIGVVDAVYRDWAHIPFIFSKLLQRCSPPAVARFVVPIGVEPVNRVIKRRANSHVVQKGDEAGVPPLAHPDSATSIFREVFVGRVFAPRFHANPNAIGRATFATNFVAMLQSAVWITHGHLNSRRPLKSKRCLAKMKVLLL